MGPSASSYDGSVRLPVGVCVGSICADDPNMGGFGEAQPTTIDTTQKSLGAQIVLSANGQKLFDLGHAVETRHASRTPGALDLPQNGFDVALEQSTKEGAQGIDGEIDGGRGFPG